jgi:predicted ATP-dependent serine protease
MTFSTGSRNLDRILGGGFPKGMISLITGPTGAGRTQLALSTSSAAIRAQAAVAYFDFEGGVSTEQLHLYNLRGPSFAYMNPTSLDAIHLIDGGRQHLTIIEAPNLATMVDVQTFSTFLRSLQQSLGPNTAAVITYQGRKDGRSVGRLPTQLDHAASVIVQLDPQSCQFRSGEPLRGTMAQVTKNRDAEKGKCLFTFGPGHLRDIKLFDVLEEAIDRSKFPDRFNREDPL